MARRFVRWWQNDSRAFFSNYNIAATIVIHQKNIFLLFFSICWLKTKNEICWITFFFFFHLSRKLLVIHNSVPPAVPLWFFSSQHTEKRREIHTVKWFTQRNFSFQLLLCVCSWQIMNDSAYLFLWIKKNCYSITSVSVKFLPNKKKKMGEKKCL